MATTSWYTLRSGLRLLARPVEVLRGIRRADLRPDFMAALTVTMVLLPQTMAYALLAGLPAEVGLYSAIIASIVGALWGSSNQLQTGPSNTVALLSLAALAPIAVPGTPPYLVGASLLALLGGILRLVMGLARLGVLVRFVSDAVIVGFTAGAGMLIVFNQVAELLRLDLPRSSGPIQTLQLVLPRLEDAHPPSLALGLAAIVIIVLLKRLDRRLPGPLIAIVVGALATALFALDVRVVGSLPRGFPPFSIPPVMDLELVGALSMAALSITAIGLVEAISNARSIASHTGQRLDSNQEFVGQGLANIAVGLFSGCPVTGSFGRSMLNLQAGARTPMANVFTGLLVAVIMLGLGSLAAYIPMASLAGVLFVTAANLIDRKEMVRIWRGGGADRLTMMVTLLATLTLPLQFAVLAGILMSLGAYLLRTSTPRVRTVLPSDGFRHFEHQPEAPPCPQLSITEILGDLYFGAVQHVDEAVYQNLVNNPSQRFLLLRMHSVHNCDISGIHALESIVRNYRAAGGDVYMSRVRLPVFQEMTASGFLDYLGRDHLLDEDAAVGYIFHHVLDPAICIYECPVRAFRECQNLPKQLPDIDAGNGVHTVRPAVPPPVVEPLALWQDLRGDTPPVVIDVREPREFRQGRVPGSQSIPLPALLADPGQVPDDRSVVFVCRGGRRSARAAAALLAAGHKDVAALRGGMLAWEAANLLEAMG